MLSLTALARDPFFFGALAAEATMSSTVPMPTNPDDMEAMFLEAQKRNGDAKDLNMTEDETKKFTKAFGDPEFRKMMAEYVDEISDPKHREEQEAYIRQMETDKVGRLCRCHSETTRTEFSISSRTARARGNLTTSRYFFNG